MVSADSSHSDSSPHDWLCSSRKSRMTSVAEVLPDSVLLELLLEVLERLLPGNVRLVKHLLHCLNLCKGRMGGSVSKEERSVWRTKPAVVEKQPRTSTHISTQPNTRRERERKQRGNEQRSPYPHISSYAERDRCASEVYARTTWGDGGEINFAGRGRASRRAA